MEHIHSAYWLNILPVRRCGTPCGRSRTVYRLPSPAEPSSPRGWQRADDVLFVLEFLKCPNVRRVELAKPRYWPKHDLEEFGGEVEDYFQSLKMRKECHEDATWHFLEGDNPTCESCGRELCHLLCAAGRTKLTGEQDPLDR